MKHLFKTTLVLAVITASAITFSSFINKKKVTKTSATAYTITLVSKITTGSNTEFTWSVTNTNPGNGDNGTLQDVSHWDVPLTQVAEAALISAATSLDGVNFTNSTTAIERDPSIRFCTTTDVLKFNVGTSGSTPTYYRATFSSDFVINLFATSWIKTGGGREGCNQYFFSGLGSKID